MVAPLFAYQDSQKVLAWAFSSASLKLVTQAFHEGPLISILVYNMHVARASPLERWGLQMTRTAQRMSNSSQGSLLLNLLQPAIFFLTIDTRIKCTRLAKSTASEEEQWSADALRLYPESMAL